MKRPAALLSFFAFQALLAFLWTFFTASQSGRPIFLWLSAARLLLVFLALAILGALLVLTVRTARSSAASFDAVRALDEWCLKEGRLGSLLLPLIIAPALLAAGMVQVLSTPLEYTAYRSWAPETFPLVRSVVLALLPVLCLIALVSLESGVYLAARYRAVLVTRASWSWGRLAPALTWVAICALVLFHWIILAFGLRTFANIRAWYWKIEVVPFSWGDAAFAIGFFALFTLVYLILTRRRNVLLGLVLVAALSLWLELGVTIMGRGGLANLADRYFSTYHKAYVTQAATSHVSILAGIQRYDQVYAVHAFTSTKPPGLMAFYVGLDHVINGHPSAYSDDVRYERLSTAVTWGFPLAALLIIPLLYLFARRLLADSTDFVAPLAPLIFVLAPAAALFTLFADQAIYPAVFLLGVWIAVRAIRHGSPLSGFLVGVMLYLLVFFAFTMLPLYPFVGLFLVLHRWRTPSPQGWSRPVLLALSIAIGTLAMYALFRLLLNYDFLPRFERTMAINHSFDFYLRVGRPPPTAPESLGTRLGQIVNAAWINNLDYAAAIGFPIYLLFLVQSIRRVWRFFKGRLDRGDIVLISLLFSFIALNLLGTAQGEVPRLWLFWLPMVALLAACELRRYAQSRPSTVFLLGLAQFVTLVLTFHFQDLRM